MFNSPLGLIRNGATKMDCNFLCLIFQYILLLNFDHYYRIKYFFQNLKCDNIWSHIIVYNKQRLIKIRIITTMQFGRDLFHRENVCNDWTIWKNWELVKMLKKWIRILQSDRLTQQFARSVGFLVACRLSVYLLFSQNFSDKYLTQRRLWKKIFLIF